MQFPSLVVKTPDGPSSVGETVAYVVGSVISNWPGGILVSLSKMEGVTPLVDNVGPLVWYKVVASSVLCEAPDVTPSVVNIAFPVTSSVTSPTVVRDTLDVTFGVVLISYSVDVSGIVVKEVDGNTSGIRVGTSLTMVIGFCFDVGRR